MCKKWIEMCLTCLVLPSYIEVEGHENTSTGRPDDITEEGVET